MASIASPNTVKRQKKVQKTIISLVAKEVLQSAKKDSSTGERSKYGSMPSIVSKWKDMGCPFVTRGSVQYEMRKVKKALWLPIPSRLRSLTTASQYLLFPS
jgi:hypothetical protein